MPRSRSDGIIRVQGQLKSQLDSFREIVKRAHPLYRCVLAAGALLVLAGVVGLSTSSRQPYFRAHGATWHASKVGRMSEDRKEESLRPKHPLGRAPEVRVEVKQKSLIIYRRDEQRCARSLVTSALLPFRSPPSLLR